MYTLHLSRSNATNQEASSTDAHATFYIDWRTVLPVGKHKTYTLSWAFASGFIAEKHDTPCGVSITGLQMRTCTNGNTSSLLGTVSPIIWGGPTTTYHARASDNVPILVYEPVSSQLTVDITEIDSGNDIPDVKWILTLCFTPQE